MTSVILALATALSVDAGGVLAVPLPDDASNVYFGVWWYPAMRSSASLQTHHPARGASR